MAKLFMLLLGCKPPGRNTEQHDVFFGVGEGVADLIKEITAFWPEGTKLHIDAWREVTEVDGHSVKVVPRTAETPAGAFRLFFINLGGYKKNEFEEFHYKMIAVSTDKGDAIRQARETAFYMHTGFSGATSHVDDKYGIDVDDIHEITDIINARDKENNAIMVEAIVDLLVPKDEVHLGYFKLVDFTG